MIVLFFKGKNWQLTLEFEDKIKKIEEDIIIAKTKADEHAVEILEKKIRKRS